MFFGHLTKNVQRLSLGAIPDVKHSSDQPPKGSDHQNGEKQEAHRNLEIRAMLQVHSTRPVKGPCNRDSLKGRRLFTCCMRQKLLPRSVTVWTRHIAVVHVTRLISRISSENDSSCNRVSNATRSVNGLMLFMSSFIFAGAKQHQCVLITVHELVHACPALV